MNFRTRKNLNFKVGGLNHLNDDVLFASENEFGIPSILNKKVETNFLELVPATFLNKIAQNALHFYLEDFVLNRYWNRVSFYGEKFEEAKCILSPDFSLFVDMPIALQIYNVYRNRYIGRSWQEKGLSVIPTIGWSDRKSFDFCFCGVPKNSTVSISTQGIKKENSRLFFIGLEELFKKLQPSEIIIYGVRHKVEIEKFSSIPVKFFPTFCDNIKNGR
jgi:hypothetical protein